MKSREQVYLPAAGPEDKRLIVIGDVHGENELLKQALGQVHSPETATLIMMGDLIDRGPDSKGVLETVKEAEATFAETVLLPGNHEQMFYFSMLGLREWEGSFVANGGANTLMEFGFNPNALLEALPEQIIKRLSGDLPIWHREGDLLFVHAGLHPDVPTDIFLENIAPDNDGKGGFREDYSPLWVRAPFYANPNHMGPYTAPGGDPVMVVYGHTRVGTKDPEEHMRRVREDIESWRFPMDCTGSGMLSVTEINGDQVHMTLVSERSLSLDYE